MGWNRCLAGSRYGTTKETPRWRTLVGAIAATLEAIAVLLVRRQTFTDEMSDLTVDQRKALKAMIKVELEARRKS